MSTWRETFDKAKSIVSPDGSNNRVAGVLDVSRQAIATWQETENVPILRALQIETITKGKITWRELSPVTADEVDAVLDYYHRQEGAI